MTSYLEQRKAVERLQTETQSGTLLDVLDSLDKAQRNELLVSEIYKAAAKNREFCKHCESVANVIEDARK